MHAEGTAKYKSPQKESFSLYISPAVFSAVRKRAENSEDNSGFQYIFHFPGCYFRNKSMFCQLLTYSFIPRISNSKINFFHFFYKNQPEYCKNAAR